MNKIEQQLVEQLIHQLIALDDPTKKVYFKSLDLQVSNNGHYMERRYLISILETKE